MFQFGWFPTYYYHHLSNIFIARFPGLIGMGFPIRKPPDRGIMTPPRRVSPSYTSFLGMNTQGIHYQLYSAAKNKGGYFFLTLKLESYTKYRLLFLHKCVYTEIFCVFFVFPNKIDCMEKL